MLLVDRARLDPARRNALEAEVRPLGLLEDVVRWGAGRTPPALIVDVVVQDEFSHDVVVAIEDGVHLVFDTT